VTARRKARSYGVPSSLRTCFTRVGKAKRRFATKEEAETFAARQSKRVYECNHCNAWHIGGQRLLNGEEL
jgi:hypothetical protein